MWTPQFVEDLIFRQYLHGEDVSSILPPRPAISDENASVIAKAGGNNNANNNKVAKEFSEANKLMMKYVTGGPTVHRSNVARSPAAKVASTPTAVSTTHGAAQSFHSQQGSKFPLSSASTNTASTTNNTTNSAVKSPATSPSSRTAGAKSVRSEGPGSSPSRPNRRVLDCVTTCKAVKVVFPPHIPANVTLRLGKKQPPRDVVIARVMAQDGIDPDHIFAQPLEEFPLHTILKGHPEALQSVAAIRGLSGDWRQDTFTRDEEASYKTSMKYTELGPSQAMSAHGDGSVALFRSM